MMVMSSQNNNNDILIGLITEMIVMTTSEDSDGYSSTRVLERLFGLSSSY